MFSDLMIPKQAVGMPPLPDGDAEPFHLDFEEHLRRYVDDEVDEIDRATVEGHTKSCAHCAEMLRDLQLFRSAIDTSRPESAGNDSSFVKKVVTLIRSNARPIGLAFGALVIIAGVSAYLIDRQLNRGDLSLSAVPAVIDQQKGYIPQIDIEPTLPVDQKTTSNTNLEVEPEVVQLKIPSFIRSLRLDPAGTLRGETTATRVNDVTPNGIAVREIPVLRWTRAAEAKTYTVEIFNDGGESVSKSGPIINNSWKPSNLSRGKIYQWQVKGAISEADGRVTQILGQGRFYLISAVEVTKINNSANSLSRGRALAEAGLLAEAAEEFRRHMRSNPTSSVAQKYLQQLALAK